MKKSISNKIAEPCFVFDFDGVLCDSMGLSIESYNWVRVTWFPQLPAIAGASDYMNIFKGDPDTCLYQWLKPNEAEVFYKKHTEYTNTNSKRLQLFPIIPQLLLSIANRDLVVLTTNLAATVQRVLKAGLGINLPLELKIYGKEFGLAKSEMFKLIFSEQKVKPENVYYICDSTSDIITCNSLGIKSIAVGYGYFSLEDLSKQNPYFKVADEDALFKLIKQIASYDQQN